MPLTRHLTPAVQREELTMTSQTYATRRSHLMREDSPEVERLLTPSEVAAMFRVDPKTVTRWARAGKLSSIRTLGGHRRYREAEVRAFLAVGGVAFPDVAQ
jgi:excisionase family DNA binding protein